MPKKAEKKEVEEKVEAKKESVSISATFRAVDEEGDKVKLTFDSKGDSLEDALNKLEFPKGVNCLVKTTVVKGDKEVEVALAPHMARRILEGKDVFTLEKKFFARKTRTI